MKLTIKTLYVFLVVLNILDMAITLVGIQLGGREFSPVALWHWEKFGVESSILFRMGILGFFGGITVAGFRLLRGREAEIFQQVIWSILFFMTFFYLVVVTRNIEIVIKIFTM